MPLSTTSNSMALRLLYLALGLSCFCSAACQPKNEGPSSRHTAPTADVPTFASEADENELFLNHRRRLKTTGSERRRKYYMKRHAEGTVAMQFSQRKRLFDHNILLRALFSGRLFHAGYGDLGPRFEGALFFDLGSAILFREGAPTVRDIHDDPDVRNHLSQVVASDINDPMSPRTRFIDIYRKTKNNLPFPVHEIPMAITSEEQVRSMLQPYISGATTPIILRTVNTGIDYYYSEAQLMDHFRAIRAGTSGRNVLYLFNKFVLFTSDRSEGFSILGEIPEWIFDGEVRGWPWRRVNWARRTVNESFRPRPTLRIVRSDSRP